ILDAFGPDGRNAPGCASGTMIASPSRPDSRESEDENASYFFQWPRDGSLCLRAVVDRLMRAEVGETVALATDLFASDIERKVRDFVRMNMKLQVTPNPSGNFDSGGLGEPKFLVDGEPFTPSWGRPQNDGPAIRASTLIKYANHLLDSRPGEKPYVKDVLYNRDQGKRSIIKDDLDYTLKAWKNATFDLWEEVESQGGHFYTLMVQRRALLDGAQDRTIIEPSDDHRLTKVPDSVLRMPHIVPTLRRNKGQPKPLQADISVLLGITHGGDRMTEDVDETWAPWGERAIATLDRITEIFSRIYPINSGRDARNGVACGRYPEDSYDGVDTSIGHPWFLTTHTMAEVLHLAAERFALVGFIKVSVKSRHFYSRFVDDCDVGSLHVGERRFEEILKGIRRMADGFLKVSREYADTNGKMSEQFNRFHGKMRGARELTWSYASFLTASDAR
ncbi:hypothetical protein IE53DRAFT_300218, partial [Violaceomyces palustris]